MPVIDNMSLEESVKSLTKDNDDLRSTIKKMQKAIRGALKVEAQRHKIEIQFFDNPTKAKTALERLKIAERKAWLNLGKVGMTQ